MLASWVRETTTTTGTGNLTLSGVAGYARFSDVFPVLATTLAEPIPYCILDDATGAPIEMGVGELTATNTLRRMMPTWTMVSGTLNKVSPSAVSLPSGTKRVVCADTHFSRWPNPLNRPVYNSEFDLFSADAALQVGTSAEAGMSANFMVIEPYLLRAHTPLAAFIADVITPVAGGECVCGLYTFGQGVSGPTGSLVAQSAAIDCSTSGYKPGSVLGGSKWIAPGYYWWAIHCKTSTVGFRYYTGHRVHGARLLAGGYGYTSVYYGSPAYSTTMPSEIPGALNTEGTPGLQVRGILRFVKPSQ